MAVIKKLTASEQAWLSYEARGKIVEKEMAENLLMRGYPDERIAEITGLTYKEIDSIKK